MNATMIRTNKVFGNNNIEYLIRYLDKIVPVLRRIEADLSIIVNQNYHRVNDEIDIRKNEYSSAEILKTIDKVSQKINNVFTEFAEIFDVNIKEKIKLAEVLEELHSVLKDTDLSKYSDFIQEQLTKVKEMISDDYKNINKFSQLQNIFEEISDDFTSIYMTLEIQNLTSQQLNMIYHILNEINTNIEKICSAIYNNDSNYIIESIKPSLIELNQRIAGNKF